MDSSLRYRVDKHIIAAQTLLFRSIVGGSFEVMRHWVRGYSGLSAPIFNVFIPRTENGLTDDHLADTAAFFSSRQVHYSVEVVHDQLPHGPDFLYQRRYHALPPQPAMALTDLPDGMAFNADFSVERVATVPALTAFCSVQHNVYDFDFQDLRLRFPVGHLKSEKIGHYLVFYREQPVGAGSIVCAENAVSVWNMATLDPFRRRGVATQLLYHMLREAIAKQNAQLAVLYSNASAYNFFNDFGFEIFTQRQWFLPPNVEYGDEDDEL